MGSDDDLRRLTIEHLRSFVALAEELNFTRAAHRLYMAPSPFGRRIKELEALVGAPLFVRTTRRVDLTPLGERLLPRAQELLGALKALLRDLREEAEGVGRSFNVGIPPGGINHADRAAVSSAIHAVVAESTVHVQWIHPAELPRLLGNGELDLALVSAVDDAGTLDGVILGTAGFGAAVAASDPVAVHDRIDLSALVHRRYAQIDVHPPTANFVELERRVVRVLGRTDTLLVKDANELAEIVATGECFTIATLDGSSPHRALQDPQLALIPLLNFDYDRVRLAVWTPGRLGEDPVLAAVARELQHRFPARPRPGAVLA